MAKKSNSTDLIAILEPYFTKQAPFQLPTSFRKAIVKWMPWVNIILGLFLLPLVLAVLGLGSLAAGLAGTVGESVGPMYWISMLVLIASIALLFITFPGLKARKLSAWKLVFWADILYFVYNIVSALGSPISLVSSVVGGLIGLVVGLYVLFQIKSYYK